MLRSFIGVVASVVVMTSPVTAVAEPEADGDAHAGRGVDAVWRVKDGRDVRYYSLFVAEIPPDAENPSLRYRGRFGILQCKVETPSRYYECDYANEIHRRVDVVSFEMDPLVMSARAVVELGGRRGDVTWTGTGEPEDPAGSSNNYWINADGADVTASAWGSRSRHAIAEGRLFGYTLVTGEDDYAWMYESGSARAWACTAPETCDYSD